MEQSTAKALIDGGDLEGALQLLASKRAEALPDEERRLLAWCYVRLGRHREAAQAYGAIVEKDSWDFLLLGAAHTDAGDWDDAIAALQASLRAVETPDALHLLAVATARGLANYQLTSPEHASPKEQIVALLGRALEFPQCPPSVFLWREELEGWQDEDVERRVALLRRGVALHPDHTPLRLRLANRLLYRCHDNRGATEILAPILVLPAPPPEAHWYAFEIARADENFEAALEHLARLEAPGNVRPLELLKLKGDALLRCDRVREATTCYDRLVAEGQLDDVLLGCFGKASALLEEGDTAGAIALAEQAAARWFDEGIETPIPTLPSYQFIDIGETRFDEDHGPFITRVAAAILEQPVSPEGPLTPQLAGRLSYVLYKADEHNNPDLLLRAAQLLNDPALSGDLSDHFADGGKWRQAIEHHLIHALWRYGRRDKATTFPDYWAEFSHPHDRIRRKRDRRDIHRVSLRLLAAERDPAAVRAVFVPFYRSFLRHVLLAGELHAELVNAATLLLRHAPEETAELWDCAYHSSKLGRIADAAEAYRRFLNLEPNNAAALHNLSLISEKEGDFEKALQLSRRAAQLAPNDDLITKRATALQGKADQAAVRIKPATTSPADPGKEPPEISQGQRTLSKRIRFETFKRDSFACQYCGAKAPDVLLHVDHIVPRSKGGTDDLLNLVTACSSCNAGKTDRQLSDLSVVEKQRRQMEEIQERKEQIELMLRWKKELLKLDDHVVDQLASYWAELVEPFSLTDTGRRGLVRLVRRYSIDEVMEAMKAAADQYVEVKDERPTRESVELTWSYVGRICATRRAQAKKPYLRDLLYTRGILRNRLNYINERYALELLESAVLAGADVEDLKQHAKDVRNWTEWRSAVEAFIDSRNTGSDRNQ